MNLLTLSKQHGESKKRRTAKKEKRKKDFLYFRLWPFLYKVFAKAPINEKLILFANGFDYTMPENFKCIYNRLSEEGYNCKMIFKPIRFKRKYLTVLYEYIYYVRVLRDFARCKCLYLDDYFLIAYAITPRAGTNIVQLWHGCGAFKKWGYSTAEKSWGYTKDELEKRPIHNTYTHVMVSAQSVAPCYAEAFNCDEKIIYPWGAPRTDIYFNKTFIKESRELLLECYPEIGNRKIILYAPTFRGTSANGAYVSSPLDYILLSKHLGDKYVLAVKFHPFIKRGLALKDSQNNLYEGFVFDISKNIKIETALCAADIVITDYSSLIFEYALLQRPMIFYAYDLKKYHEDRNFYFGYEGFVPGPLVTDSLEIIEAVKDIEKGYDERVIKEFAEKYMNGCDGKSTDRIIDRTVKQ